MKTEDIKNYEDLVDIIYDNEESIQRNYQSKKDQILLHKQLLINILNFLTNEEYSDFDKLEIIKLLIRDVLELKDTDLIIIKKEYIFIKLYDDTKRRKISKSEVNTQASRFNGIDEAELESFYSESFSLEEMEDFFYDVAVLFIKKYFLDSNIDNLYFEKDAIKLIQKLIIESIHSEFNCDKEFCLGFSGYMFRKHFKLTFEFISELLLKELAFSNKSVIKFLKYYSLDIIVVDDKKYKVPHLTADNGLRWHVGTMMNFTKVYVKANEHINELENNIQKIDKEILSYLVNDLSPVKYNNDIQNEYLSLAEEIEVNSKQIDILQDSFDITKDNNKLFKINISLEELKNIRVELREEKSILQRKKIKQKDVNRYQELIKQMEILKRDTNSFYKILEQNEESFESIKNALVKALMSKKQLI